MDLAFQEKDNNFLGLEDAQYYSMSGSAVVIQPLPYEYTSSYQLGSKLGPEAIIQASQYVEFFDEEILKETCFQKGICTLKPINFESSIDEEAMNLIYKQTTQLVKDKKFVISIGAEHTITYGVVKAFKEAYNELSILQIDAHSDLRERYEGNKWSHASVMSRCMELDINSLAQVGIRALSKEEAKTINDSPQIHTIFAHQMDNNKWQNDCLDQLTENVYITIDADGFDPSIMPAVGTPEPNGLLWNDVMDLLKLIFKHKNVVGFDVVECAPKKGETITEYNLAKLIYKLIGLKYKNE
jgi:agmatinase